MSSFCTAKATHIFFSKKFQYICISLNVNFSFEQPGPDCITVMIIDRDQWATCKCTSGMPPTGYGDGCCINVAFMFIILDF